jgi:predicted porin
MQKKLIALAVAGLVSGAAFAQSNVTIYGTMDGTYDSVKATGSTSGGGNLDTRGRATMNSSFIGFKGSESLGNGLTAVFQIETGVGENAAGGTNSTGGGTYGWANRDTMIAIAGGFGTVALGNLTGPARWLGAQMDVNSGATGIGANTALIGKLGGGSGAGYFDQRFANAIAYISPSFSGFSGVVAYVPNENRTTSTTATGSATNTSGWTAKLAYVQGPITAAYAWTKIKDTGTAGFGPLTTGLGGATITSATDNRVGGKFDFGMGTVGLMYDQVKADLVGGLNVKQNVWYLPVTFNVGGGKIIAQYGQTGNVSGSAVDGANLDMKAKHFEVGYEYSLSKRTIVKALYSQITNNRDARYDFLYGASAPNTTGVGSGVAAGADPKGFSVGLRHSF